MLRKIALTIGILAMIGTFPTVSAAKHLEDILMEKGVITEEEYKQIAKPELYFTGRKGFTFISPEGKNSVTIGGQMQPQYDYVDSDEGEDSSKFEIKRIKLWLMGQAFSKDLTYKVQMRLSNIQGGDTKNGGLLEETRVRYRFRDDLQILFGQTKMRFGRQAIISSKVMHLVDKSQVTKAFFPTYDTGLLLHGKVADGLLLYEGGVFGGAGQNTWSKNNRVAWNARLAVNPLGYMKYTEGDLEFSEKPLVSLAANYYQNKLDEKEMVYGDKNHLGFLKPKKGWFAIGNALGPDAEKITGETVEFDMYGFDLAFKWKGFWVQGEYMEGKAEGQDSNNELKSEGFYVQGSYFVIPKKLALGYRYSQFDPNKDVSSDKWVENTAGISWYVKKHSLKVQADYTNINKESVLAKSSSDIDDKRFRFQVQLLF